MKLDISNFAKIGSASLNINGLTVIAGQNNTGKSTVGKILFSIYNSLYDLETQVDNNQFNDIRGLCSRYFRNSILMNTPISSLTDDSAGSPIVSRMKSADICENIARAIYDTIPDDFSKEVYESIISDIYFENDIQLKEDVLTRIVDLSYKKFESVVLADKRKIALELVFQYFDTVFSSQIQSLKNSEKEAEVVLSIKGRPITMQFTNNSIGIDVDISILHEAYLLDDPFAIDDLHIGRIYSGNSRRRPINPRDFVVNKISVGDLIGTTSIFETIEAKEKIETILEIVNGVVPGKISSKGDNWTLSSPYFDTPVDFSNLSAGLKSFVLIKLLLEKGLLKEKDVLILDEPEIHLHPEWQLKYAEIIVLLQKQFDLTIIVTTHSREFFDAIDLYSKKHRNNDKCNYYLTEVVEGLSYFKDVTDEPEQIYRQLVTPGRLLDKLRYELENEQDD